MSRKHEISFIVSIHQPNIEVLDIFDNLYVLSKGGVNVYSGSPQYLRQHMNDCHIDCEENDIPIEKLLKVCANDCQHPWIVEMQEVTQNGQLDLKAQVDQQMVINRNWKSNWTVKFSPSSIWYLTQRMVMVYYYTLTLPLLMQILLFGSNQFVLLAYYDFTITKYRDCRLDNSTQQCNALMNTIMNSNNVQYEIKLIYGFSLAPLVLFNLWTCLVMFSHINVFIWEYHNGLSCSLLFHNKHYLVIFTKFLNVLKYLGVRLQRTRSQLQ